MKLSLALLAAASPALVSGRRLTKSVIAASEADLSNVEIKAESKMGSRLLSKARRLGGVDEERGLQDEEMTWITGYSIKFHS